MRKVVVMLLLFLSLTAATGETYSFENVSTLVDTAEGVGTNSMFSHSGEKSTFILPGLSSSNTLWEYDHVDQAVTQLTNNDVNPVQARPGGQLAYSGNEVWILFGSFQNAPLYPGSPQQRIAKFNPETGEAVFDVLTPSHLGFDDSTHSVTLPSVSDNSDGTSQMAVLVHDWSQSNEVDRLVGIFVVDVNQAGNPIDANDDGLADTWEQVTEADNEFPALFQYPQIRGNVVSVLRPFHTNSEIYLISGVGEGNPPVDSFTHPRLFRADPADPGYVFAPQITPPPPGQGLGPSLVYGVDRTGNYDETQGNFGDANFDVAIQDIDSILNGDPPNPSYTGTPGNEAFVGPNPLTPVVQFSSEVDGVRLATLEVSEDLLIDPETDTVAEDFELKGGFGFKLEASAGDPGVVTSAKSDPGVKVVRKNGKELLAVNFAIFTANDPSADILEALDGSSITSRNVSVSADILINMKTTVWYPQGRVEDLIAELGSEEELDLVASAGTVTKESLDTAANIGVWTLSDFTASSKATDSTIELAVGLPSGQSGSEELPAATVVTLGFLAGIMAAAGAIFVSRRKQIYY